MTAWIVQLAVSHSGWAWGRQCPSNDPPGGTHLLLPEDEHAARLDGVPGGQAVAGAQLLPVLECFPQAIPCRPGDTDVMPLAITDEQRQLCHLRVVTRW
jgi:hypothetical protein